MAGELVMKLIATERNESTFSKLTFSVKPVDENGDYRSTTFNIHNVIDITFLLTRKVSDHRGLSSDYAFKIAAKRAILAEDLIVILDVRIKYAGGPGPKNNLLCTEKWCDWVPIYNLVTQSSSIDFFEIWIDITVSKVDSIIKKLYEDEEFTDFQLSTAEGSVAVHKAQLAANSEVFKTMLRREWKETTEGCINMEAVTLQTLQDLKGYMYLGTLPVPGDRLYPLLHISMCYMIDNLKTECLIRLAQTITAENLYDILAYSFINNIPELTFVVLGAMPKSIVEDARKIMIESQKSCKKDEADKTAEQEQSNV